MLWMSDWRFWKVTEMVGHSPPNSNIGKVLGRGGFWNCLPIEEALIMKYTGPFNVSVCVKAVWVSLQFWPLSFQSANLMEWSWRTLSKLFIKILSLFDSGKDGCDNHEPLVTHRQIVQFTFMLTQSYSLLWTEVLPVSLPRADIHEFKCGLVCRPWRAHAYYSLTL